MDSMNLSDPAGMRFAKRFLSRVFVPRPCNLNMGGSLLRTSMRHPRRSFCVSGAAALGGGANFVLDEMAFGSPDERDDHQ